MKLDYVKELESSERVIETLSEKEMERVLSAFEDIDQSLLHLFYDMDFDSIYEIEYLFPDLARLLIYVHFICSNIRTNLGDMDY